MTAVALAERLAAGTFVVAAVLATFRFVLGRATALRRPAVHLASDRLGSAPPTAFARMLARAPRLRRARELAVLESVALPNGASLHVIRAGARRFVVGRSGTSFAVVCELDAAEPAHASAPAGAVRA